MFYVTITFWGISRVILERAVIDNKIRPPDQVRIKLKAEHYSHNKEEVTFHLKHFNTVWQCI
jgi:hypothetical protein